MDLQHHLQRAVYAHQQGRFAEAAQLYRDILAVDPRQPDALQLLGLVEFQNGNTDQGFACFGEALRLRPNWPEAYGNLGHALQGLGRLEEAIACYRRALELKPDLAEAHNNLGNALQDQGKLDEAVASFRRALDLKPDFAEVHNNLGNALQILGKLADSVACHHRALELRPDFAEAHNNLGNALQELGRRGDAVPHIRRALELKPDFAQAHNNLGNALHAAGKLDEAVVSWRRALELKPDLAEALNNLGNTLHALGKPVEAAECCSRAVELKPDFAEAHNNLGVALQTLGKLDAAVAAYHRASKLKPDFPKTYSNLGHALHAQGKLEAAIAAYRRALELKPDFAEAHNNHAMLTLLMGDFERGWPEYEWRWKTNQLEDPGFSQPRWDGTPLGSRTILLHAEQGFGDTLQFVRYAALIKQHNPAATVIVECQPQLIKLLARCPGIDHLVGKGDNLPRFDVHSPFLSLPLILRTSLNNIPANVPYLFADQALVEHWRERLSQFQGLRIGINWEGRSTPGEHLRRNIPLTFFTTLAQQVPGTTLISLQKGPAAADLARFHSEPSIFDPGPDFDSNNGPFMDTAAVMMNLDLIITSDTAVPHLAGALGAPVWLALPFEPDWRWLLNRTDSPWYPTMRLFRQPQSGDWAGVFQDIRAALQQRFSS